MRKKKLERYTKKNLGKPLTEKELRDCVSFLNKEKKKGMNPSGEIYKFRDNYYFISNING